MKCNFASASQLYKAAMHWMDASTVIITTPRIMSCNSKKISDACDEIDYNVMMLQRSSKSSFFANAYVFPGGKIDEADSSPQWIDLYCSINKSFVKHLDKLKVKQCGSQRPPMFRPDCNDKILREVSYRICAIRETFEETGVLLARVGADDLEQGSTVPFADFYQFDNPSDVVTWQKRVHDDASQFIKLCSELRCVPDVWGLHEWCDWLTPSEMFTKQSKRYDTVFYKAALAKIPKHLNENDQEITHIIFNTSKEILDAFHAKKIIVGPPQIYELSRLLNFNSQRDLVRFASDRGLKGMERWLPVRGVTQDGVMLFLYPGDHWYPVEAVERGDSSSIHIPLTYEKMVDGGSDKLNHLVLDMVQQKHILATTYQPPYGHVLPVSMKVDLNPSHKL